MDVDHHQHKKKRRKSGRDRVLLAKEEELRTYL